MYDIEIIDLTHQELLLFLTNVAYNKSVQQRIRFESKRLKRSEQDASFLSFESFQLYFLFRLRLDFFFYDFNLKCSSTNVPVIFFFLEIASIPYCE